VRKWRREQALWRTYRRRPDLLSQADLTDEEKKRVRQWREESGKPGNP
jgi:tRNA (guanine37-N1)-methyltransferase